MNDGLRQIDLNGEDVGEIELPKLDVSGYVGKKAKIEQITTFIGKYGYCVKVETESLATIKNKDGDTVPLRAGKIFGLQENDGQIGWGKDTKLGKFLKSKNVNHYEKLKGKEVMVQMQEDSTFLTIV